MLKTDKGFTLIELVVVIAIIAILAAIAVPSMSNVLENAKIKSDLLQLRMLNTSTQSYASDKEIYNTDIFEGINADSSRIEVLINEGYYAESPEPQMADEEYNWSVENQVWNYSRYLINNADIFKLVFDENFTVEDYIQSGNGGWYADEDGLEGTSNGILFIPNERDEYTITTEAVLDTGTGHGYGIMFDTTVDHGLESSIYDDNGYCLQFDRGYGQGAIIIRERINGSEQSPEVVIYNSDNSLIPSSRNDSWWSEEHTITTQVTRIDDDTKAVTVLIDGVEVISSHEYDTDINPEQNNTGFRVWGESTQYNSITIE